MAGSSRPLTPRSAVSLPSLGRRCYVSPCSVAPTSSSHTKPRCSGRYEPATGACRCASLSVDRRLTAVRCCCTSSEAQRRMCRSFILRRPWARTIPGHIRSFPEQFKERGHTSTAGKGRCSPTIINPANEGRGQPHAGGLRAPRRARSSSGFGGLVGPLHA